MNTQFNNSYCFFLLISVCGYCCLAYSPETDSNKYYKVSDDWYEAYSSTNSPAISSKTAPDMNTRLFFPPGASLTLNPQLSIPVINPSVFGVGSTFMASFPVTIMFDKLSLKNWDDIKDWDNQILVWDHNLMHGRKKRSFKSNVNGTNSNNTIFNDESSSSSSSLCRRLSLQKLFMFRKMESLMHSYNSGNWGWNKSNRGVSTGEDCFLRTICEIYNFPITEEFGVFGNLLRELVRADQSSNAECLENNNDSLNILTKYIEAQQSGEKGSCKMYYKKCEKSLFY